ncbi:amidase [Pseudomonas chlororaphis]|uniref:amidase n=1 Tax=Pseudomonas chlororaphis TaxID=587753 RepID=UPI000B2B95B3|nr:amidase [Pseudomonas chlororaphis]AZD29877.1 Aspartyl-tRNA(Asn) amidotransferase subunit A [Pseudomonas chlororaphis]
MPDFDALSIPGMARAIREGETTSRQLVEFYLCRIAQNNGLINAVVQQSDTARLLEQADEADRQVAAQVALGPLHGVPITIKDVCHVEGFKMSCGMPEWHGQASPFDATVVRRLREAGALILGITNVPELCMSFETENFLYGRTRNPFDLSRTPGGSSGGEAAAIAAGCSPGGLGSDAGGSLRIPAHFNGICGFKLTQGRVPLTGQYPLERTGLIHMTSAYGVMGRHVDDIETLGYLIAGADGHDPDTVDVPFEDHLDIRQARVALFHELPGVTVRASVLAALQRVAALLEPMVRSLSRACPEGMDLACDSLWNIFLSGGDGGRAWDKFLPTLGRDEFSTCLQGLVQASRTTELSVDQFKGNLAYINTFRRGLSRFFREHDLLICPVFPDVAFKPGESLDDRSRYAYVFPFSLSGSPVVVLPVAFDPELGLPIGIQIIGPHWKEPRLLALAKALESQLSGWRRAIPREVAGEQPGQRRVEASSQAFLLCQSAPAFRPGLPSSWPRTAPR